MDKIARKKILLELYFTRYDTFILDREKLSNLLGKSTCTIDRWREKGLGPKWSKDERSKNGTVSYAIDHVVDYIISQNANTMV